LRRALFAIKNNATGHCNRRVLQNQLIFVNLKRREKFMQPILQRTVGVVCLVIGILLLVHGHDIAQSLGEQVRQFSPFGPSNRSTYFYIAGAVLGIFGLSQIIWPARPK
jgi:hypothetical protein